MGCVSAFNYAAWVARYPEFANVTEPLANAYFAEACLYHRNDGGGVVNDPATQLTLLNMVTAHIAKRYAIDLNGNSASDLVGRIASATQGSVSVVVEMPTTPDAAWFNQTQYGAGFWAMSSIYRRFRVIPGCPQYGRGGWPGPWGGGGWNGGGLI